MKYFKLTTQKITNNIGIDLFRIELISDCVWGKIGDKGGFLEKENNLSGNAWVSGNAQVYGNAWHTSPLQIQGSMHFVTECKKGYLKIGCQENSLEYWKSNFNEIGKINNYSEKQIKEYELYINLAILLSKL